jgi:hypothetical protein
VLTKLTGAEKLMYVAILLDAGPKDYGFSETCPANLLCNEQMGIRTVLISDAITTKFRK